MSFGLMGASAASGLARLQQAAEVGPWPHMKNRIHPPQALAGAVMRGLDEASGSLLSYVDLEARIPARHPLRKIRQVV